MRQPIEIDDYFLALCDMVAQRSKDPSTQVGAVIVRDGDILATGYNGFPAGLDETPERWERPTKYGYVVHAEENAVLRAARQGVSIKDATLYVSLAPCVKCARFIANSGIQEIVFNKTKTDGFPRGDHHELRLGRTILSETGIEMRGHVPQYQLSIEYEYSDEVPF